MSYSFRWAESSEALAEAEYISGDEFTLSSAMAGKELYLQVAVSDKKGNTSLSIEKKFYVEDRTAPQLAGSVSALYENYTLRFDWEQASDNVAVTGFLLTINGKVYDLKENSFTLSGVTEGTFSYKLRAYDAAGNVSQKSLSGVYTVEGRAELAVESLRIFNNGNAVSTAASNEELLLTVDISNTGSKDISGAAVRIFCGDTLLGVISDVDVAAKENARLSYTIAPDTLISGLNELRAVIDTGSSADEYSKLNNEKNFKLFIEERKKCDLVIDSVAFDKEAYGLNDKAILSFAVRNAGYGDSGAASVAVYSGNTLLGSVPLSALKPGTASDTLSLEISTADFAAGTWQIRIVADPENIEAEAVEENNSAFVNMVVGGCDLKLTNARLSGNEVTDKENVTLYFTVQNIGTVAAAGFSVSVYDGDVYLGNTVVPAELAAGFSVSGQFIISKGVLAPGMHNIRAVVDAEGSLVETDRVNNTFSTLALEVIYLDDEAPRFSDVSISQSKDGYLFTVNAAATDNVTLPGELAYLVRFAGNEEALAQAEIISGKSFTLDPAQAGEKFFWQAAVQDGNGNISWSEVRSFTVADTTGPEIKNIAISLHFNENMEFEEEGSSGGEGTFTLSWESSDNVQVSHFNVYVDGVLQQAVSTPYFVMSGLNDAEHTYRIEAFDINGNVSSTRDLRMEDDVAPGIRYISIKQNKGYVFSLDVAAEDNFTSSERIIYYVKHAFDPEQLADSTVVNDLEIQLSDDAAGKTLYYQVGVADENGNTFWSTVRSVAVSDVTAPGKAAGLHSDVNGGRVALTWNAISDNVAVDSCNIRYGQSADLSGSGILVNGNGVALENLAPGEYFWQVRAVDTSGNVGEWSDCSSFVVFAADPFENNDAASMATELGVIAGISQVTGGVISSATDTDWFSFTLDSKGVYGDAISIDFNSLYGELALALYSADGNRQLLNSENGSLSLKGVEAGTYLFKVTGINGTQNSYTVTTRKQTDYAVDINDSNGGNDSMAAATIIDIDRVPTGSLEGLNLHSKNDTDFYKFTLTGIGEASESVSIFFKHKQGDLDLFLWNSSGEIIDQSTKTGNHEKLSFKGLAAGTYYVQVAAPYGAVNEYDLEWKFSSRKVAADGYEDKEPVAISASCALTGLTISENGKGSTREDVFLITLDRKGNSGSRIRFANCRSDWPGIKYILTDENGNTFRAGTGTEISLDGLAQGTYTLTVDTPVDGSYGQYDMSVSLPETNKDSWAVFVYMAADNNLDQYALDALLEMQKANLDAGVEVYVLWDRASETGTWSDTRVGKLVHSSKDRVDIVWESWGELNTGSPDTLARFLEWGGNQAPDCEK